MSEIRGIGKIYNYYGGLCVKEESNKYYWSIEDWNGHDWKEITKELYDSLNKFEDENPTNWND